MADWVRNAVTVHGRTEDIPKFKEFVRGTRDFDFEKVIPVPMELWVDAYADPFIQIACYAHENKLMPEDLRKEGNLSDEQIEKVFPRIMKALDMDEFHRQLYAKPGKEYLRNHKKYGFMHWHEFCTEKWGTKWNASDTKITCEDYSSIAYTFDTAYDPPIPVMEALSEKFPDVEIRLEYQHEDTARVETSMFGKSLLDHIEA